MAEVTAKTPVSTSSTVQTSSSSSSKTTVGGVASVGSTVTEEDQPTSVTTVGYVSPEDIEPPKGVLTVGLKEPVGVKPSAPIKIIAPTGGSSGGGGVLDEKELAELSRIGTITPQTVRSVRGGHLKEVLEEGLRSGDIEYGMSEYQARYAVGELYPEEQFEELKRTGEIPKGSEYIRLPDGKWGYYTPEQLQQKKRAEAKIRALEALPKTSEGGYDLPAALLQGTTVAQLNQMGFSGKDISQASTYASQGVTYTQLATDWKEIQSGKYMVPDPETGQMVATTKAYYDAWVAAGTPVVESVEQIKATREQEIAKAKAETLPVPEVGWVSSVTGKIVSNDEHSKIIAEYEAKRDQLVKEGKMYTSDWFALGEHPAYEWSRYIPVAEDILREVVSAGRVDTMTFNRSELEKQYQDQKEITLAVLTGDRDALRQLYLRGAFGEDTKQEQVSPMVSTKTTAPRETFVTTNQAYDDALRVVQQQEDIEGAVKSGNVDKLKQLYQEGAFGNDLAAYTNLVNYVEGGGRELSPVTSQDIKAVSDSFGTKKDYVDAALKAQPTTASMARDVAIAMVPVYGTAYFWDRMGTGEKALAIATDALSLIPIIGGVSAAAKVAAGAGRGARIASAMKVIPKLVAREVFAPIETVLHPIETAKAIGSTAKGLVNILNPRHIPSSTLSTVYSTVRLDTAILGDQVATVYVRDQLMALQAAGKEPVVLFGDKIFTLRSGTFLSGGGVVHASPDIRFVGGTEGFTVTTKTYPKGHPKAGMRLPASEQGLFVANIALERFAVGGSAFGFEKGVASATENIKAITNAADQARAIGDLKKADKLIKLVDDYNNAIATKSIKALDKAESKIVSELVGIAEEEVVAKISAARATASERYAIGDIRGAQEAMQEALSYENQLQKARPGFAIFSPEVNEILVPSGKTYTGMIFQPKAGEFWSIAMREMKSDKAAQLLQQAQDATRLGDQATAARLTREANDLIKGNKSGFRRAETTEMELKFPEFTQMRQLKPRYTTMASDTGAKLWIYTTEPYSLKKAIKAKLMAPIDTLRNIYDPAISVKTIPMTRAQKLARISELLEQARVADKAGDATRATLLRSEAGVIQRSMKGIKGTTKVDDIASAVARADKIDSVDELIQSAKRAEMVGDYASADRLRRAADAVAGKRYVDTIIRRAGTVSGLAEYARALGAVRLDEQRVAIGREAPSRVASVLERRAGESARGEMRRSVRLDIQADRLLSRVPEARVSELRTPRTTDTGRGTDTRRDSRTPDVTRIPDTGRVPREPVERVTDTRLPRGGDTRVSKAPGSSRVPSTGRTPETPRVPRTPEIPRRSTKVTDMSTPRIEIPEVEVVGRNKAKLPLGSITVKHGAFWRWAKPPWDQPKMYTLPKGVAPLGAKNTDKRTVRETVQMIGEPSAPVPETVDADFGIVDFHIYDYGQRIEVGGKGLKTNVGTRVDSTAQGMKVEDGGSAPKGHAYARKVYPKHSVSRSAMDTEEPVRGPKTTVRGINRPEIAESTKELLEESYQKPETEESIVDDDGFNNEAFDELGNYGVFGDEDPNWLRRRVVVKKSVNLTKKRQVRPTNGQDSIPRVRRLRL